MEIHDRIKGCIQIEQTIASIYNNFTKSFPKERVFWESLFKDEIEHASFLSKAMYHDVFAEQPDRTNPPAISFIEKTLEYALYTVDQINYKNISFENALKIALTLEEAMVETFVHDLMVKLNTNVEESIMRELDTMLNEEKGHVSKINNMMIKQGYIKLS